MNKTTILLLAGIAYYLYTKSPSAGVPLTQLCKFPDGSVLNVPIGSACPYDASKGGQSNLCMAANQLGPFPPGVNYC